MDQVENVGAEQVGVAANSSMPNHWVDTCSRPLSGHLPNTESYLNFFSSAQLPKPWSGCPALPEPSSARFFGLFIQIKPFCVVHIKQKLQASLIIKNNPPALRRRASASSPQSLSRDLRPMHAELIIFSFMWSFPAYATSLLEFSQHSATFILIN